MAEDSLFSATNLKRLTPTKVFWSTNITNMKGSKIMTKDKVIEKCKNLLLDLPSVTKA